jgi:hypothetical protein
MTDLCREFGISRKTGRKFARRFDLLGAVGLADQRRVPVTIPHRTSVEVTALIVELRKEHPTWGPKKLHEVLTRKNLDVRLPAHSTIGDILVRHKLIVRKKRRGAGYAVPFPMLSDPREPNDVWCIDYKGQHRLGNRGYCYPLTLTDARSANGSRG